MTATDETGSRNPEPGAAAHGSRMTRRMLLGRGIQAGVALCAAPDLFGSAALFAAPALLDAPGNPLFSGPVPNVRALGQASRQSGVILGTYTIAHELQTIPIAAAIIEQGFAMIADGNDLKFSNRLRPAPDQFDFSYGDVAVNWATAHQKLFRGHCLVWSNALPSWFSTYVTPANALHVMTSHITTVMQHYKGRIYAWDVVNEAIDGHDRPDGLRVRPWLKLLGPDYIEIAFRTARAADPHALLVLNDNYIEHNTPAEQLRRRQFLALITRLKRSGVPLDAVGLQGHLRGSVPLDIAGIVQFAQQVRALGLQFMITELDVDSLGVDPTQVDAVTAAKYREFLEALLPYCASVTLEQLADSPPWEKIPPGYARADIFDNRYQPVSAYYAVVQAFASAPARAR